jgi:hypothetical protein
LPQPEPENLIRIIRDSHHIRLAAPMLMYLSSRRNPELWHDIEKKNRRHFFIFLFFSRFPQFSEK